MPRVLVVDDHSVFAEALTMTLAAEPGFHCLPPVGSAEDALDVLERRCADVVLLDVHLPGMSGVDAVPQLLRACPHARILLLTAGVPGAQLLEAIEGGVCGFLRKDQSLQEVVSMVAAVDEGIVAHAHDVHRLVDQAALGDARPDPPFEPLTTRELDVLLLLADSVPVKQIARELDITIHTCRGHVRSVLHKLDAHSQLEAVLNAARYGMLPNLHTSHG